jgi:hypothetical protein
VGGTLRCRCTQARLERDEQGDAEPMRLDGRYGLVINHCERSTASPSSCTA